MCNAIQLCNFTYSITMLYYEREQSHVVPG